MIASSDFARREEVPRIIGEQLEQADARLGASPSKTPNLQPAESEISGEATVGSVASIDVYAPGDIDYYSDDEYIGSYQLSDRIRTICRLKLGEIALLRRLTVAFNNQQEKWRCETLLKAAQVSDAAFSLARLNDMGLLRMEAETVHLTGSGKEIAWLFTQCLIHDQQLVSAYRHVTPQINRTIRLDGRSLTD